MVVEAVVASETEESKLATDAESEKVMVLFKGKYKSKKCAMRNVQSC